MWRSRLSRLVLFGIVLLLFFIVGFLVLGRAVGVLDLPPTDWLVRNYVDDVARRDIGAIKQLASPACSNELVRTAQGDMALYGGSEVRSVQVNMVRGEGSDDTLEFLSATFEYRTIGQPGAWQQGSIADLSSTYRDEPSLLRHLCPAGG